MKLSTLLIFVWLIGVSNAFSLDTDLQRRCIRYTEKTTNDYDFAIECKDIGGDGIGSSYLSHKFSLAKGDANVTDYNWRFLLKNEDGEYVEVSIGNSEEFTIEKIDSPDDYFINTAGELEGLIECDYFIDGANYSSDPFAISLELKPIIISIDNQLITYNDKYSFYLTFDIVYAGADSFYVDTEGEYSPYIQRTFYNNPYFAHVVTDNMTRLYYSWVTICVTNKYGEARKTLEFEPNYENNSDDDTGGAGALKDSDSCIELYNINGLLVYTGTLIDLSNQNLQPGIYIQKEINSYGIITTSKITIK